MSNPRQVQQFYVLEFAFLLPAVVLILSSYASSHYSSCCSCHGTAATAAAATAAATAASRLPAQNLEALWDHERPGIHDSSHLYHISYIQPGNPALFAPRCSRCGWPMRPYAASRALTWRCWPPPSPCGQRWLPWSSWAMSATQEIRKWLLCDMMMVVLYEKADDDCDSFRDDNNTWHYKNIIVKISPR